MTVLFLLFVTAFNQLVWVHSSNVKFVNPILGTQEKFANDGNSGGMIPSTGTPFAMTRWTATTKLNYIGSCPYLFNDNSFYGFLGTHQPAVWLVNFINNFHTIDNLFLYFFMFCLLLIQDGRIGSSICCGRQWKH